jgi:hypothetical protein
VEVSSVGKTGVSPESNSVSSRTANQRTPFWCFGETPSGDNNWLGEGSNDMNLLC